jgi:hypothetical protein
VHLALVAGDADVEGLAVFLADRDDAQDRVLAWLRDDVLVGRRSRDAASPSANLNDRGPKVRSASSRASGWM